MTSAQPAGLLATHPLRRSPAFRNLFLGDVLVTVAERYFVLTVSWWLLGQAQGGARLGVLLTLLSIPVLVVGLVVGPLVDRLDKRLLLVGASVLQGLRRSDPAPARPGHREACLTCRRSPV